MQTFTEHEYIIPTDWLCCLINGDESGMEEESLHWCDVFIGSLLAEHNTAHVIYKDDLGFGIPSSLTAVCPYACDQSTVVLLVEDK